MTRKKIGVPGQLLLHLLLSGNLKNDVFIFKKVFSKFEEEENYCFFKWEFFLFRRVNYEKINYNVDAFFR